MKRLSFIVIASFFLALILNGMALAQGNLCTVSVDYVYGVVSSSARIIGSADSENFSLYKLEYSPQGSSTWTQIGGNHLSPATDPFSLLETWDTRGVPEGSYNLRLVIEHNDGSTPDTASFALTIDHTNPVITLTSPRSNSTDADPRSILSASFSEKINSSTASDNVWLLLGSTKVPCSVLIDASLKVLNVKPKSQLKDFTNYSLVINREILDLAGNQLKRTYTIKFRTADITKPTVKFVNPTSGVKTTGKVSLVANVKDNTSVKTVMFYVDKKRVSIASKRGRTYFAKWNSYGSWGGKHTFKVIAEDFYSNKRVSTTSFIIKPKIMDSFPKPKGFSPDGNKVNDITSINFKLNTPSLVTAYVLKGGKLVKFLCRNKAYKYGLNAIKWDGKDSRKKRVHNGFYRFIIYAKNRGGLDRISGNVEVKVGLKLEIDGPVSLLLRLGERKLYLLSGKRVVSSYGIAVGKPGWRTPKGWFSVVAKQFNPTWYPPQWSDVKGPIYPGPNNPLGPRRLLFTWDGYGIHGTNNPSSIGHAVSHGCVRMHNWAILEIFPVVPLGAPIHIVS